MLRIGVGLGVLVSHIVGDGVTVVGKGLAEGEGSKGAGSTPVHAAKKNPRLMRMIKITDPLRRWCLVIMDSFLQRELGKIDFAWNNSARYLFLV
jgi:hypothetical protein